MDIYNGLYKIDTKIMNECLYVNTIENNMIKHNYDIQNLHTSISRVSNITQLTTWLEVPPLFHLHEVYIACQIGKWAHERFP